MSKTLKQLAYEFNKDEAEAVAIFEKFAQEIPHMTEIQIEQAEQMAVCLAGVAK